MSMTPTLLRFLSLFVLALTSAIISAAWAGEHFETGRVDTFGHDAVASCNSGKPIH
jgi:hypothetical protein